MPFSCPCSISLWVSQLCEHCKWTFMAWPPLSVGKTADRVKRTRGSFRRLQQCQEMLHVDLLDSSAEQLCCLLLWGLSWHDSYRVVPVCLVVLRLRKAGKPVEKCLHGGSEPRLPFHVMATCVLIVCLFCFMSDWSSRREETPAGVRDHPKRKRFSRGFLLESLSWGADHSRFITMAVDEAGSRVGKSRNGQSIQHAVRAPAVGPLILTASLCPIHPAQVTHFLSMLVSPDMPNG